MIVWNVAFNIAFKDDTIQSIEAVQDDAGARLIIGTQAEFDMAIRLPKFAEFLAVIGVGGMSYLPPEVDSYDFRFSATVTNGSINVCGSNEELAGDVIVNNTAIFEELQAAPSFSAYFASASAVLINAAYVDYAPGADPSKEASNVIASLTSFGKAVNTFVDISAAGLQNALLGVSHLVIPQLENYGGNGADLFSNEASAVIRSFVQSGHTLVTFFNQSAMLEMVNDVFDWSISEGSEGSGTYLKTAAAADYGFGDGQASLLVQNATQGVAESSLPPNGVAIYKEESDSCAVALIPYGIGRVIMLGWDWYDAAPVGAQDNGWLNILDIATD